jgi:hypothetical protein
MNGTTMKIDFSLFMLCSKLDFKAKIEKSGCTFMRIDYASQMLYVYIFTTIWSSIVRGLREGNSHVDSDSILPC